jgi:hypothetical protein
MVEKKDKERKKKGPKKLKRKQARPTQVISQKVTVNKPRNAGLELKQIAAFNHNRRYIKINLFHYNLIIPHN